MFGRLVAVGLCSAILTGCASEAQRLQESYAEAATAAYQDDANCRAQLSHGSRQDYEHCRRAAQQARLDRWRIVDFIRD